MTAIARGDDLQVTQTPGCAAVLIEQVVAPVVKPAVAGLAYASILSSCVGVSSALEHGLAAGGELGVRAMCITAPLSLAVAYVGPPLLDLAHHLLDRERPLAPDGRRKLRPDPAMHNRDNPQELVIQHGEKVAEAISKVFKHRPPERKLSRMEQTAPLVEVERHALDVVEFYDVLSVMYGRSLARSEWSQRWENWTTLYYYYIGPRNADLSNWEQAGLWKQWRIVRQVDRRGRCEWAPGLTFEGVLRKNRELWRYAQSVQ